MYNLFVSAGNDTYDGEYFEFDLSRSIKQDEFTDAAIAKKFAAFDAVAIENLSKLPCLFAHETSNDKFARLGWIKRIRVRQSVARIDFTFDRSDVQVSSHKMLEMRWALDISDWEMNRHHWAVKDVDLFEALGEAKLVDLKKFPGSRQPPAPAAPYAVQPTIFRIPITPPDPLLVSVMMPYSGFDAVYAALKGTVESLGYACQRADKFWEESELIQDIFSLIYRSKYVICDFTGSNANVFYEAGIAHTLGREVIPITQTAADVSFDLRHHRYIRYLSNKEGLGELSVHVFQRLEYLKGRDA